MCLRWRLAASPLPVLFAAAVVLVLIAAGQWMAAAIIAAAAITWAAALTIAPLTRLPATLRDALVEAMDRLRVEATLMPGGS